jgi:hypothetical protein
MLKMLNKTRVTKPCFKSLRAIFLIFELFIILPTIYKTKLPANYPKRTSNIILQLLINDPAIPNLPMLVGNSAD